SEKELRQQRDLLEEKVEERTKELKQTQLEKVSQLYRFAEFGRLSSGILHDLVTPLTSVSLNLSLLTNRSKKINKQQIVADQELLEKVALGVTRMELFVKSVRKQLQKQEVRYSFNVVEEIKQVLQVFNHRLDEFGIKVKIEYGKNIKTVGNPIKFNQIISNIINNAIDAYDLHKTFISKNKKIIVRVKAIAKEIQIEIQDFGCGIPKNVQKQIFKPLFTTKGIEKGTGIGLYITKEIIEKDFFGKISFTSKENEGTIFIIKIPELEL
ncbi:MAG TPA: HAMP domain-containing sensor histidine kinase, partial [Patescibacteria group bacterium]